MGLCRTVSLVVGAVTLGAALSGCNTSALTKRELVVQFKDGTPISQQLTDRAACLHVTPQTVAEPLPSSSDKYQSDIDNQVRYRIDHANDNEVSKLEQCFGHQPDVLGFEDNQDEMN